MSRPIFDNPLAWSPNPRARIQVRVHRLDGVCVWSDHRTMRAAEESAHFILNDGSMTGYVGPRDLVEVIDTRRPGATRGPRP